MPYGLDETEASKAVAFLPQVKIRLFFFALRHQGSRRRFEVEVAGVKYDTRAVSKLPQVSGIYPQLVME